MTTINKMSYTPQIIELADGTKCVSLGDFRKLKRELAEARAAAKLAYSILGKVNKQSLENAAWRAAIKHINNTPMDWLKSIVQKWEEVK